MDRLRHALSHAAPRLQSLAWSVWAALTALAYLGATPDQLEVPARILPVPLWAAWAVASALLFFGAITPPAMPPRHHQVARWFRIIGISIVAGLLVLWTEAFLGAGARGWVSSKNYAIMVIFAIVTAFTMGREGAARGH